MAAARGRPGERPQGFGAVAGEPSAGRSRRWRYVYRAIDQFGQVIDVFVAARRDAKTAHRFFKRANSATKVTPVEVTTDQASVYLGVLEELLPAAWHRTDRYANNRIECDHGRLKARLGPMRGLKQDRSFVLKDIPPEELPVAVRTVADGGALLAPSITRRLIGQFARRLAVDTAAAGRLERLTDRERDMLAAIARGSSNAEISDELFIGAATVKSHVSSILAKLGLRDRAQMVVFAYESGLVEAGEQDIGH